MPRTAACPSCGASLRVDAPWCTLCYTDLRPKPEPVAPPTSVPASAAYGLPAGDPLTQPLLDFLPGGPVATPAPAASDAPAAAAVPTWPCGSCESPNPFSETHCGTCGKAFLASVQDGDQPLLVLPLVGDIGRLSRPQRLGVALGAVALLLVPLALITILLTGRPPASGPSAPTGTTHVTPSP